ncbi:hypothetical protein Agabi119p4_4479 [Agaricus bisporus var. burnettii]|uniref:RRM domain-containing protein n=1 Tax=Agaricus bisporus var. burnettii TaxID=192524 RepID=A0A8H7KHB5_AGABI|nr:hypothetical protein Agabi119p4_4479 [Agaricus bisporus var. burnettii]
MSDAQAAQVTENGVPPTTQEETPGFKVFAGNLAYSTTDEGLKAFFDPVIGDVLSVQVIMRGQRSAGYGFVALTSEEAAQKAVDALNKKELDGRPVIIEIAKPADQKERKERRPKRRPGRRGGKAVPGEVTEAEANGEIPKAEDAPVGTDEASKPKKKKKSARKPKAKVDGAGEAEPNATAEEGAVTDSAKKPRRKFKAPRTHRPVGQDPVGEPSQTMLFVANLGFNIDDDGLSALFTEAGINVVSARIVRRRWGHPRKSKGYGFVDVGSEEEQKKAIEVLEGKEVSGRPMAVKIAVNTINEDTSDEANPADTEAANPVSVAA